MLEGRRLVPVGSINFDCADSAFSRFFARRVDADFGGDIDLRVGRIIKHVDYPLGLSYRNAVYEVRADRIKDGVPTVALVIIHKCPQYCYEGWKVCRYTGFKPYKLSDVESGLAPTHIFADNEYEIECVCKR